MDWFATIVGVLMIAIGCLEYFFPVLMNKWDAMVGRGPSSPSVHKVLGGIGIVGGVAIIVLFNYLSFTM
jgi:hypothetical protein